MANSFRPLLSAVANWDNLHFPIMASPKLDGHRCFILNGKPVSRTLKPIPNRFVNRCLEGLPSGLDGELIVGPPVGLRDEVIKRTSKGIRAYHGEPAFSYYVFDHLNIQYRHEPFSARYERLRGLVSQHSENPYIQIVPHEYIQRLDVLEAYEERQLSLGYEGIMLRDPCGSYKFGRSTEKEGILLKVKRWQDAEAVVVRKIELEINTNPSTYGALGLAEKSSAKAGQKPGGTLGALECRWPPCSIYDAGILFEVGSGYTAEERLDLWLNLKLGAIVNFKHLGINVSGRPRSPIFRYVRTDILAEPSGE